MVLSTANPRQTEKPRDSAERIKQQPGFAFLLLAIAWVGLAGCAGRVYLPEDPASAAFLQRALTETDGPVRLTVAVPDSGETQALFGLPLHSQGIQPVWLEIENRGTESVRVTLWSIDPDYYSPLEVAWKNRKGFSKEGKATLDRWFHDTAMPRRIPAGATRSGFVYTNLTPGTKGFNVDVFANDESFNFTFFVPIPGFTADYMNVDFENLYEPQAIQRLSREDIRAAAGTLICCGTNDAGDEWGDPINVILIGTGRAVRRALLRAGWDETALDSPLTEVSRLQRFRGRRPDGTFQKARADGTERKELRLWLAPATVDDVEVWVGQASQELSNRRNRKDEYRIDPDIDAARDYVLQNFWYSQSLLQAGFADGVPPAASDAPATSFSGSSYFTNGLRAVLWLSEDPVGLDESQVLPWESLGND